MEAANIKSFAETTWAAHWRLFQFDNEHILTIGANLFGGMFAVRIRAYERFFDLPCYHLLAMTFK